jgi:flagellin FlaB
LIQTSTTLESQALSTGRETIHEVAGGIAVFDVEGIVNTDLDGLAITVRARAGSPDIDLNETIIILSEGTKKVVLQYDYADANHFNDSVDADDGKVFGFLYTDLTVEEFGIMVLEDADGSCSQYAPVINAGDKVMLFVDAGTAFGAEIPERTDVFGFIYPEHGSPGVISFRTPASYSATVFDLQ